MNKTVAVVIPVYNEEGNVDTLCRRLENVFSEHPQFTWRAVFIDDGSRDKTVEMLTDWQTRNFPATILRLTRNFGHQAAIKAGLDHVDADAVITLDADLQHPPEFIARLLELWQAGNDVVQTVRTEDATTTSGFHQRAVRWAYRVINWFAERPIPPQCADFRLIDRKVLTALKDLPEANPMLRGLVAWVGFRQTTVEYPVQKRLDGESRFSFMQLLNLLLGGIFDLSRRPLMLSTAAGTVLAGLGILAGITGIISGLVSLIFILAAIELLALGLVGEYLGRAYHEVLGRPLYIVSERVNFDKTRETPY